MDRPGHNWGKFAGFFSFSVDVVVINIVSVQQDEN